MNRRSFVFGCAAALAPAAQIRITGVRTTAVHLAKRFAPTTSNPFAQLTGALMVEIETDQGITGYGMGGGGTASAHVIERHLKRLLLGANPLDVEKLSESLYRATLLYGRRGLVVMALSGIDLALWDIAGKHAGKPVYELLGGARKQKVPAYYTSSNVDPGLKLGLRAFKTSVRENRAQLPALAERLKAIRKRIGPDAKLMIDCSCAWDVETTLEAARRLEEVRLEFLEEPISPDDLEGYERLCREVKSTKIAHGEHQYTRYGFREVLRHNAAHILQPDMTWSGGLTEGRLIAAMAAEKGIPVIPHRGGSVFGMALILSHDNCPMAESFGIEPDDNELMQALRPPFEDGHFLAWKKPGFGLDLTAGLIRSHARAS